MRFPAKGNTAMKKTILTIFTLLTSIGVVANNQLRVHSPSSTVEVIGAGTGLELPKFQPPEPAAKVIATAEPAPQRLTVQAMPVQAVTAPASALTSVAAVSYQAQPAAAAPAPSLLDKGTSPTVHSSGARSLAMPRFPVPESADLAGSGHTLFGVNSTFPVPAAKSVIVSQYDFNRSVLKSVHQATAAGLLPSFDAEMPRNPLHQIGREWYLKLHAGPSAGSMVTLATDIPAAPRGPEFMSGPIMFNHENLAADVFPLFEREPAPILLPISEVYPFAKVHSGPEASRLPVNAAEPRAAFGETDITVTHKKFAAEMFPSFDVGAAATSTAIFDTKEFAAAHQITAGSELPINAAGSTADLRETDMAVSHKNLAAEMFSSFDVDAAATSSSIFDPTEFTAVHQNSGVSDVPVMAADAPAMLGSFAMSQSRHEVMPGSGLLSLARPYSAKALPLLISGQTTLSTTPMFTSDLAAQRSEIPRFDTFTAAHKGPSIGDAASTALENLNTNTVERPSGRAAVLITAQSGFSAEMLRPLNSKPVFPPNPPSASAKNTDAASDPSVEGSYCDPNFVGPPIRFSQTIELKLEDLLGQLHSRFGVNFIIGPKIGQLPMNVKAGSIPWNVLLRSQLFISGVRARCIDANTIELVENKTLPQLQDQADVKTRFVKLKFLQRTTGGSVDLANRAQGGQFGGQGGGCSGGTGGTTTGQYGGGQNSGQTAGQLGSSKFDKLIIEIEKILGLRSMTESSVGGGSGGNDQGVANKAVEVTRSNRFVTQIPGRNILAIRATDEEHELIDQIISRADRPPFQVVIKALVYTANEDKLRDIGVQTTITDTSTKKTTGGVFGHTLGALGTLFDFSTMIGTVDFNVQASALQRNGAISIKSRPFATVMDGLCTTLEVGRQIPIVIDSTLGGQGDVVFVSASNKLAVTPYVVDDELGNPMAVTLELRLDSNDVDRTVASSEPTVSVRSINTQLLLNEDKTAILGGFTVDSDNRTVSKTPGLGDIPILGELFKRRVRATQIERLYFAITVSVIPYGDTIAPVSVPGATTEPPSLTPELLKRSEMAEPKTVAPAVSPTPSVTPKKDNDR